jgi:hypothetical protein
VRFEFEILRLTVARGMRIVRDAAEMLPASTTARKTVIASTRSMPLTFQEMERKFSMFQPRTENATQLASPRKPFEEVETCLSD